MKKITFFVFICFMFLFPMGLIFAQEHSSWELEFAPLNPDFLKYRENVKNFQYQIFTDDGYPLGYIPSPVLMSNGRGVLDKRVMMSYPLQYDLRTKNKLTPIKDQDGCGACWTFAAMASLESYLMPTENRDFSEQHMNANHGFDYAECEGGNDLMSTAYLARWDGPLNESDAPYPYSFSCMNANTVQKHVQQVIFISDRANSLDNDTVKYFITNYGAVKCSFYYRYTDYNSTHNSYYTSATCRNHGVVIIGWDDNFPAYKFNTQPPGNGAFIAKNSWGTHWGDNGYFYISYYDTSLSSFIIFNNVEPSSNYQRVYQYDPLGWTMTSWGGSFTAWGANIFTAEDNLPIRAVGFYLTDVKVKYEIHIYKGVKAGKPRSGTLAAKKIGSKTYSGYYTEKLDSSVSLTKGTKFSVVIKFTNTSFKYPVAVEHPLEDYSSKATANAGESYYSRTGSTWNELSQNNYNTNVCIKVFAGGGSSGGTPRIDCSRKTLNFGGVKGGNNTISQSFRISNSGSGPLNWTVSPSGSTSWLKCSPTSGTNTGTVSVSVDTAGLSAGTYTDYLYVSDSNASNSPQTVTVKLAVKNSAQAQVPFGEFATPIDSSTVMSSVPVTGWVLDDIEVVSVKIYNGSNYIGDAMFVEGARPDVELAYPGYPLNYRAGWGYMLLTYFLPNGGNGTYTIYAKAKDKEGHVVTLGSKRIYGDNDNAVKPFGAIDTPTQGGTASGSNFINWGWVLTPQPNKIPTDGSTINVYVNGVNIGHPVYNIYRSDIAKLFPGYANSTGAIGRFFLDTTAYESGVHTIQWTAKDSSGNIDGIGSRYFTIQNMGSSSSEGKNASCNRSDIEQRFYHSYQNGDIPVDYDEPIKIKRGFKDDGESKLVNINESGDFIIKMKESERLEIKLSREFPVIDGYTLIGNQLKPLPIGSTLDIKTGKFYWQPGAGFVGHYRFVFIQRGKDNQISKKNVIVMIEPKFAK